jgi:type IV secretory pathway TrbF-like protein
MAKTSTSFKKGEAKGRPKGTQNKLTRTVKETVLDTFNLLQEDRTANLLSWAKEEPTEFYKIASKLIPTEVKAKVEVTEKQVFKIGNIEVEF